TRSSLPLLLLYSSLPPPSHFSLSSFHPPAPTPLYTLSLHDALPISPAYGKAPPQAFPELSLSRPDAPDQNPRKKTGNGGQQQDRSEEHTSELQSRFDLVCRLLLEKKKKKHTTTARDTSTTQDRHTTP